MYEDRSNGQLTKMVRFARCLPRKSNSKQSFIRSLKSLNIWKRQRGLKIYSDFCDNSITFQTWIFGGMIYHILANEWSIHT